MPTLDVRDRGNKVVETIEVGEVVFDRPVKKSVLHEAVVHHQAGTRQGSHSSKTRAEVHGSKRKPWRQKGTGRARHGDRRSPIWRHGGIVFGPKHRDHSTRFPRGKMRRALQMALSSKMREEKIFVLDELGVEEPKTRLVAALLSSLGIEGKTLIYDPEASAEFARAARNLPDAKVVTGRGLTVYDLLRYDNLLTSKAGINAIDEALR